MNDCQACAAILALPGVDAVSCRKNGNHGVAVREHGIVNMDDLLIIEDQLQTTYPEAYLGVWAHQDRPQEAWPGRDWKRR